MRHIPADSPERLIQYPDAASLLTFPGMPVSVLKFRRMQPHIFRYHNDPRQN